MSVNVNETKQYGVLVVFSFFFFFFVQLEAPSDSPDSLMGHPTLGEACSLELSTLVMQGNAVKQTTCCWSWQYA